jgi:hypothetical protein
MDQAWCGEYGRKSEHDIEGKNLSPRGRNGFAGIDSSRGHAVARRALRFRAARRRPCQ